MHIIAQTERIIIREYLPDEMETYLIHLFDEQVAKYIPKRTREERIVIFENALKHYQTTKTHGIWGMFNNTNGEFIGGCLLRPYNGDANFLELGYSFEHKYWGQGLATEMVEAMITYGFANTGITAIVACTELLNIASQRVLEKNSFIRGGNFMNEDIELVLFRLPR